MEWITNKMRQPKVDKQKMYYSNFVESKPIYERDEEGNIVYVEVDGELVPVEVGTEESHYGVPIPFKASISSNLNEMHIKSWGVDQSSIYSEICCRKGYLDLKIGSIIWRTSEVQMESETRAKASSSDYTVVGLMDEDLYSDFYLLKRNSSDA